MERASLAIEGMHCGSCVNHVARALNAVEGVSVEKVAVGSAEVAYEASKVTPQALARAVADAGYDAKVTPARPADAGVPTPKQGGGSCGCCHP